MSDVLADSRARLTAPLTVNPIPFIFEFWCNMFFQFQASLKGIRFLEDGRLSLSFPARPSAVKLRIGANMRVNVKENLPHSCLAASPC